MVGNGFGSKPLFLFVVLRQPVRTSDWNQWLINICQCQALLTIIIDHHSWPSIITNQPVLTIARYCPWKSMNRWAIIVINYRYRWGFVILPIKIHQFAMVIPNLYGYCPSKSMLTIDIASDPCYKFPNFWSLAHSNWLRCWTSNHQPAFANQNIPERTWTN